MLISINSVRPMFGSEHIRKYESLFSFMKPRWAVAILLVVFSSCSSPSEVADPLVVRDTIIDMHLHAFEVVPGAIHQGTGLRAPDTQQEYEERTLALLEEYDVLAVTSGPTDLVQKWKAASPDRIIPGLFFRHPSEIELEMARDLVVSGEISVLGEIAAQSEGLAPNDPLLEPYFSLAEEFDIPVALHMGMSGIDVHQHFPHYRSALSNPLLLEEVLIRHSNLRIYVMHAGWPMLDEMIHLMWSHSNVYVDTGVIDWVVPRKEFHTYLRRLVEAGFGDRIMFGSDQMNWPEALPRAIEAIETADFLSEEQKRDILYNNAARFLRLGDNE